MFYDHMLTFEDEVQLIWKARTTLPKMLFLFNRYAVPLVLIIKANGMFYVAISLRQSSKSPSRFQWPSPACIFG